MNCRIDCDCEGSSVGKDSDTPYLQFSSTGTADYRTHEGYLWKRGALLKGWKQRFFVLDSMKHQVLLLLSKHISEYTTFF